MPACVCAHARWQSDRMQRTQATRPQGCARAQTGTVHVRTARSLGPWLHARRSVHARVARSTLASLGPRSHACSPHAHAHARPTRACSRHTRSTHSLALGPPLRSAHEDEGLKGGGQAGGGRAGSGRAGLSCGGRGVVAVSLAPAVAATVAMVAAIDISACSARHRRARQLWPLT